MNLLLRVIFLMFCIQKLLGQTPFESLLSTLDTVSSPANKQSLIDSFMTQARQGSIPIIDDSLVTFIHLSNEENVAIGGDFNNWAASFKRPIHHVDSTNLWYYQQVFEQNARFDYAFFIDGEFVRDRENPRPATGYINAASELAMPDYVHPWEIEFIESVPEGRLETVLLEYFANDIDKSYRVSTYLPAGYDSLKEGGYPVVYFQDGSGYLSQSGARVKNTINNLVFYQEIEPIISVYVNPYNRGLEYLMGQKDTYAEFFARHLTAHIDSLYNTIESPEGRLVVGPSYGGNISAYIAYQYSDIFGNCGLNSAAFRPSYDVFRLLADGPPKNVDFYAIWGTYEHPIHLDLRALRDILLGKGYTFKWAEYPEGHNWGFWRATVDDILKYFYPFIEDEPITPETYVLRQNYPNPFNPKTTISYDLKQASRVSMKIYDVLGREIITLIENHQNSGSYQITFYAGDLPGGVYFYRLDTEYNSGVRKMLLLK
ncbi:MAG: T9SS type A sorting domain-containing protein [FCB group bacterium]|nr:T9SS type A sorting domain-containing protein [FCB group bacterium]MBL7028557.1 T9SS type A sorting domain-containing protein [Candidatus Neomarinimicrobiota bacterium]MBL7120776.1 T9SS type A sorting domain-containing protein [Candidatus Neomarinimicrobiota bacterium]